MPLPSTLAAIDRAPSGFLVVARLKEGATVADARTELLLAAVGLYAVVAHSVIQRTQEIGVRMAIGATGGQIWRWVLRQGMASIATGLVVGLAASLGVNRVLRAQFIGVEFYDL